MTDPDLLAKRLAIIETAVEQLRTLARPEGSLSDIQEQRFIEHTLQIAIQAALDVTSHSVSIVGWRAATNRELFDRLAGDGSIDVPLADSMRRMVGFRNVLVHGYDDVDLKVVEDVITNHLDDLLALVRAVRSNAPP